MLDRMNFKGTWRDYQARVLDALDSHFEDGRLHIVAAPGAGKTVLGLEIVRRIGRPALVLAPTITIREQWAERLYPHFLDVPPGRDDISHDIAAPRALTLATYQALGALERAEALESLVAILNDHGPLTLVLDEAHHLRREWWRNLDALAQGLEDVRIVSLTATPPYDASFAEWARYEAMCGPIDLEIGIPELVRNGDLCPHQDHVVLSEPDASTLALLDQRRAEISRIAQQLRADKGLLDWLLEHPWLVDPESHVEAILEAPEMLSAVLVLLGSAGRPLPKAPLALLGVSARDLPAPSRFWLERFLDGMLVQHKSVFPLDPGRYRDLRGALDRQGLIEGGRVRLHNARSAFRLMTNSLAKLDSIISIARSERRSLGESLRMVVLTDHIRAGEMPTGPDDAFLPAKLGVVPIFEAMRRADPDADDLAVLTGSLVILPRTAIATLKRTMAALGLTPDAISVADLPACPGHVTLSHRSGGNAELVRIVTALFVEGIVRILVGTQSLLGEGWDAPALNSLVLASNAASYMLSNQMRGRAIRIDRARPEKVANIWHLATVDPHEGGLIDRAAALLNWGALARDDSAQPSDLDIVARRFKAFEGIANGDSTLIENGVGRLGMDPALPIAAVNAQTLALAADRSRVAAAWQRSLGLGTKRSQVREAVASSYAPRGLSWAATLHALSWSAAASGAFAAANELRSLTDYQTAGAVGMALAGAAGLATLPRLAKAARLMWRNGSLEGNLRSVALVCLKGLHAAGLASDAELHAADITVRATLDGRRDIVVTGLTRPTERQLMLAVSEVLGPIQNPRYLLVRRSLLGWRRRVDYHAVPTVLGARKETAERFLAYWHEYVGASSLVFTRSPSGRRLLLRARSSSLAAGFQRMVDRRSIWL